MIVKTARPSRANSVLGGGATTSKGPKSKDSRPAAGLTVRKLRRRDLDRVLEIERASFGPEAWDRNLFAEFLASRDLFLGAWRGGRLCGYLLASARGARAELMSIAVDPPARKRGAASALIRAALRQVRRGRAGRFSLMVKTSNREAQGCYAKFGFRRIRRVRAYYEDGSDGLLMSLTLAPGKRGEPLLPC